MSTSIQVKSQLSRSQYSALGTELPAVNDSFAHEEGGSDSIGSCL